MKSVMNNKSSNTEEIYINRNTKSIGFWRDMWYRVRLTGKLFFDRRVSVFLKLIPLFALGYIISPLDFLPDAILGLGQLDDIGIFLISQKFFQDLAPKHVVAEHMNKMRQLDGYAGDEPIIIDQES